MKEHWDVTDPEPCRMEHEDTEEQRGWCVFLILHYWCWRTAVYQIKSLLLSHHHSTCALVSEILESVLLTVQKQFTYRQYILTDCTDDNVQNTHTYSQYTQCTVENSVLLKCRKLRREDQETSDWIVSRISLFYDMSLVSVVIEISS